MSEQKKTSKIIKINSTQAILGSFLFVILLGSILLSLPISSKEGVATDFLSCLFTATSSLCVTGLVVVDTATHWSIFGQAIILILIQLGGMGIILIASIVSMFAGRKIGLSHRSTLQEALSVHNVGGVIKLSKFILRGFILFEGLGAIFLFIQFIKEFDLIRALWYSIFHSISAFCNAGFDLMGFREKFSSLTSYRVDTLINITIMILIIVGGIGFSVWDDVVKRKQNVKKYTLQSKLVILTTLSLILLSALYFYIFEYNGMATQERFLASFFQSVTTRTAGFNTMDFNEMSDVGKAISIILMLIGGSPGSTAGGMKTTTVMVLFISTCSIYRKNNEAHIFNRRIEMQIVRNAITIFFLYVTLFLTAGFVICKIENITLMESLFETASAIGTVGLTLGITTKLSEISRFILILLMFFGRVGGLTFVYAIIPSVKREVSYISEDVTVG